MRKIAMPVPFEKRTVLTRRLATEDDPKTFPMRVDPLTYEFMTKRYVVLKDFIPKDIIKMTLDTWRSFETHPSYDEVMNHEKRDITWNNPKSSIGKSHGGWCTPWGNALHDWVHKKLDDYIDLPLEQTYSYTRNYERGAYLGSHLDRASCEISATICLDYKSDDGKPWPIWIRGDKNFAGMEADDVQACTQLLNHRHRKQENCSQVYLEPGDLLLYQGPNAPHWRDYFLGDYSYHIFLHFFNQFSSMRGMDNWYIDDEEVINGKEKNSRPAMGRASALLYDGRPHRLETDNDKRTESYNKFMTEYNGLAHYPQREELYQNLVNNYEIDEDYTKGERKKK
jgi:hypothetical protein